MKKQIHEGHRKRMKETYLKYGLDAFSDVEKIEFFSLDLVKLHDAPLLLYAMVQEAIKPCGRKPNIAAPHPDLTCSVIKSPHAHTLFYT